MPRRKATPARDFSFAAWRGVPCFDFDMCLLLAHAPLDAAAAAFVKTFGGKWLKDVGGKEVRHKPPAYVIYQFKDHPWTVFDYFVNTAGKTWTTQDEAKRFSRALKDKVILFPISDTGGVYEYAMYDKGKLFERVGDPYPRPGEPYELVFESPGRRAKPPEPRDLLKFIDRFMREQDVLIPPFGSVAKDDPSRLNKQGHTIRVEYDVEFQPENLVRVDYVSVG